MVGGVYLTGSEAWWTGTVETGTGGGTCRQLWLLHGTVDKGVWTWNKQIVAPNNDLAVCSGESSVRAWRRRTPCGWIRRRGRCTSSAAAGPMAAMRRP